MIQVNGLKKYFKSGDLVVKAVDGVNFSLKEGTFDVIVGKSGSGKSTLLSLLGGLDKPDAGTIMVDGIEVTKFNDRELINYRRSKVGFVFQSYNLIPNLSVLENVMLPLEFKGISFSDRQKKAELLLKMVGIGKDKFKLKIGRLSGGEQQRVAIARALANDPKLILADEPTGNLDTKTGKMIFDLLHRLSRLKKKIVLVVTHDVSIAGKADQLFRIIDGKLYKKTVLKNKNR